MHGPLFTQAPADTTAHRLVAAMAWSWIERGLFWLASLLLLIPNWSGFWIIADLAGLLLGIGLVAWERTSASLVIAAPSKTKRVAD